MAKLKAPLLSLDARGSIADELSYTRRRHVNIAEKKPVLPYFLTLPTQYQRWLFQDYAYLWTKQSDATKLIYERKGRPLHLTGTQYWMKVMLSTRPDVAGMWHLDTTIGTKTPDSSKNNNPGTLFFCTLQSGIIYRAYLFNGTSSFISMTYNLNLEPNSKTLEAFCYPTHTTGVRPIAGTFNYKTAPNAKGYCLDFSSTTLRGRVANAGGAVIDVAKSGVALNIWHHVMLVHNYVSSKLYLYLDGTLVNTADIVGYTPYTAPFRIGRTYDGGYFKGKIDEVIVYNRPLDSTDAKRHSERSYPSN